MCLVVTRKSRVVWSGNVACVIEEGQYLPIEKYGQPNTRINLSPWPSQLGTTLTELPNGWFVIKLESSTHRHHQSIIITSLPPSSFILLHPPSSSLKSLHCFLCSSSRPSFFSSRFYYSL